MTNQSPNWCKIWIFKSRTFRKFEWSALKLLDWRILLQMPLGFWGSLKAPRPPAARCATRDACRRTPLWKFLPTSWFLYILRGSRPFPCESITISILWAGCDNGSLDTEISLESSVAVDGLSSFSDKHVCVYCFWFPSTHVSSITFFSLDCVCGPFLDILITDWDLSIATSFCKSSMSFCVVVFNSCYSFFNWIFSFRIGSRYFWRVVCIVF